MLIQRPPDTMSCSQTRSLYLTSQSPAWASLVGHGECRGLLSQAPCLGLQRARAGVSHPQLPLEGLFCHQTLPQEAGKMDFTQESMCAEPYLMPRPHNPTSVAQRCAYQPARASVQCVVPGDPSS